MILYNVYICKYLGKKAEGSTVELGDDEGHSRLTVNAAGLGVQPGSRSYAPRHDLLGQGRQI